MRYLPRPYEPEPSFSFNVSIGQAFSVIGVFVLAYILPSLAFGWLDSLQQSVEIKARVAGVNTMSNYSSQSLGVDDILFYAGIFLIVATIVGFVYLMFSSKNKVSVNEEKLVE